MNNSTFPPMRVRAALPLLVAAILPMLGQAHAEPAKPAPTPAASVPSLRQTYDSFRLVHIRNIFDPDRRPFRPNSYTPSSPTTRADYAALTGTMLSGEKSYAFFSGSRLEFNRVLIVSDKIANATITGITAQNIEVEREGKRTTVAVGQTVPFDNQTAPGTPPIDPPATTSSSDSSAPAATTASATPPSSTFRPAAGGAPATGATAPKGPPGNLDEIRRRMMEKRQQELK